MTAYGNLVGVPAAGPSCGVSGELRVVAGSASTSLLYEKVAGTQPCGSRMPLGGSPLSAANIQLFEGWINAGAANN